MTAYYFIILIKAQQALVFSNYSESDIVWENRLENLRLDLLIKH